MHVHRLPVVLHLHRVGADQKFLEVFDTGHHRRRFVTPEYLAPLFAVMAPGAEFRVATDIPDYVRQAREEIPKAGFFSVADGPAPWSDWPSTRYEQKALREGRMPHYLTYARP